MEKFYKKKITIEPRSLSTQINRKFENDPLQENKNTN